MAAANRTDRRSACLTLGPETSTRYTRCLKFKVPLCWTHSASCDMRTNPSDLKGSGGGGKQACKFLLPAHFTHSVLSESRLLRTSPPLGFSHYALCCFRFSFWQKAGDIQRYIWGDWLGQWLNMCNLWLNWLSRNGFWLSSRCSGPPRFLRLCTILWGRANKLNVAHWLSARIIISVCFCSSQPAVTSLPEESGGGRVT